MNLEKQIGIWQTKPGTLSIPIASTVISGSVALHRAQHITILEYNYSMIMHNSMIKISAIYLALTMYQALY